MKRQANKLLMEPFDFAFDDWEADMSYRNMGLSQHVKIFEIGNGDPSLTFALSLVLRKSLDGVLYIDPVNTSEVGDDMFIRKKLAFSTIYAEGCEKIDSLEVDILNNGIHNNIVNYFGVGIPPSITIVNFCKNKFYTLQILKKYSNFINSGTILFNNVYENEDFEDIFKITSKNKKSIIYNNSKGIGLIMAE
jgi:hypothetical protein